MVIRKIIGASSKGLGKRTFRKHYRCKSLAVSDTLYNFAVFVKSSYKFLLPISLGMLEMSITVVLTDGLPLCFDYFTSIITDWLFKAQHMFKPTIPKTVVHQFLSSLKIRTNEVATQSRAI